MKEEVVIEGLTTAQDEEAGEKKAYVFTGKHHGLKETGEEDEQGRRILRPHVYQPGERIELNAKQAQALVNKIKDPNGNEGETSEDVSALQARIAALEAEKATLAAEIDELKEAAEEDPE